jgi:hypothetical protein
MTDSHLAFRECVNQDFLSMNEWSRGPPGPQYSQGEYHGLAEIYGLHDDYYVRVIHKSTADFFVLMITDVVPPGTSAPGSGKSLDP